MRSMSLLFIAEVQHMAKTEVKNQVLMVRIPMSLWDEMQVYRNENFNPSNAEVVRRALVQFVLNYNLERGKK